MATFNKFRHLFDLSLKVTKHRRDPLGRDYTQNAFRSMRGAAIEITRLVVERNPGFDELREIIRQQPTVSDPNSRVYCHLKICYITHLPTSPLSGDSRQLSV